MISAELIERIAARVVERLRESAQVQTGNEWTHPDTVGRWKRVFGVHYNTMARTLERWRAQGKAKKVLHLWELSFEVIPEVEKARLRGKRPI